MQSTKWELEIVSQATKALRSENKKKQLHQCSILYYSVQTTFNFHIPIHGLYFVI